jgi:hypothetical protein
MTDTTPEDFLDRHGTVEEYRPARDYAQSNGKADDDDVPLICKPLAAHPIATIPPRKWAYGRFLIFGEPAVIGAVDGGGKGAQAVVIALSMITDQSLVGERVWRQGPVAIISYEDSENEWARRIAAACLHYELDYESVISNFHFITRPGSRVCLASPGHKGIIFPDGDAIIRQLRAIGAVLLIIDPFNQAHSLEDGNNNVTVARVAGEVGRIAHESDCAVLVLHHLRKGSVGDPDDLMGATALRATFRSCRIMARMTSKEAERFNIPNRQAWRYSRVSGSKENYAPPPELALWYRLKSVTIGNGAEPYADGDNVQVITAWTPPSPFEELSLNVITDIFVALRKNPAPREFYSPDPRSKRWAGKVIMELAGKSGDQAASLLKTWIDNEVLVKDRYQSAGRGEKVTRVTLNESKAAEILGPIYVKLDSGGDE